MSYSKLEPKLPRIEVKTETIRHNNSKTGEDSFVNSLKSQNSAYIKIKILPEDIRQTITISEKLRETSIPLKRDLIKSNTNKTNYEINFSYNYIVVNTFSQKEAINIINRIKNEFRSFKTDKEQIKNELDKFKKTQELLQQR